MTTPQLFDDLRRDEGLRLEAYPDPLTGEAPWTIGYGHTGSDVRPGITWAADEAEMSLVADVDQVMKRLDRVFPWWRSLDDVRQDVLVEMAFNLGVAGLLNFHVMLADCQSGRFDMAAAAMLMSEWAGQVGDRAMRLSILMKTGKRPAPKAAA